MRTGIYEQAVWQWIGLLLTLTVGTTILIGSWRASNWMKRRLISDSRGWQWERLIYPAFGMLLVYTVLYFIDLQVNITGKVMGAFDYFLKALILVFASWGILVGGDILDKGIAGNRRAESTSIANDVTRLIIRIISLLIIFVLFYNAAERFGIPVSAVFASAGIAGFAVAMAAKGTLSNLFGGVTILVEQVRSNPLAAQDPEPRVRFRKFGDSSLDFELLCWAKRPHDRGKLMHRLNTDIYNAFAGAGIEIPFPQRDVHLKQE